MLWENFGNSRIHIFEQNICFQTSKDCQKNLTIIIFKLNGFYSYSLLSIGEL